MSNDPNDLIRKLDDLLDTERRALVEGDLQVLATIIDKKEHLIDALNKVEFGEPSQLLPINEKLVRNQKLLEQALNGIRSIAEKLAALRQAQKSFDTYDRLGHKNRIEVEGRKSVEKRA